MIEIFSKKAGLLVRELWFAEGVVPSDVSRDIDYYVQCESPIQGSMPFKSISVDLTQDENILFGGLSQSYRRQVRRAVDTDRLVVDVDFTPTAEVIESFGAFFNEFAAFKGIAPANLYKMKIFGSSGHFFIASVRKGTENSPLAMYSYVSDGYRVRGYIAGTLPRNGDDAILLGRANKLMQWEAMLAMKKADLKVYDFGGISSNSALQGINEFKRQFGGIEIEDYNAVYGISWWGCLALKTSNLLNHFLKAESHESPLHRTAG